jgi:hypothetical protein
MKLIKLLGVAAVAVLAVMLFFAGTAAADTACSSEIYEETCAEKNRVVAGTKIEATLKEGEAVFSSLLFTVKCKAAAFVGEVTKNEAVVVNGHITSVTFGECTGGCTEAIAEKIGEGEQWQVQTNWVSYDPKAKQQQDEFIIHHPVVHMQGCTAGAECEVHAKEMNLDYHTTPTETWVVANEEPVSVQGAFPCPSEGKFKATFKLKEPSKMWISQKP